MLKALVVDDEKMTRDVLVNYIPWKEFGVDTVEEADDGVSALALASASRPDIVLSDVRMPRMNGIELATRLREQLPHCKFIFLSGYSDKEYLKSAIRLKAVSYVEKPINLEEIVEIVRTTIEEFLKERAAREKSLDLLKQELCLDLISGKTDLPAVKEKISLLNLNFPEAGRYVTAVVRLDLRELENPGEPQADREMLLNSLCSFFGKTTWEYVFCTKGDEHMIFHFHCGASGSLEKLKDLFVSFLGDRSIPGTWAIPFMVGLGQEVSGLADINRSYRCGVVSLQKQFYKGYGNVGLYEEQHGPVYIFDENVLAAFRENVTARKKTEAALQIKRMSNDIRKCDNTSPDYIRNIFFKFILVLSRIAEDRNIPLLGDECKFILESVSTAHTLDEIEKSVVELVDSIITHMESNVEGGDIVSRITCHIAQNYQNEALSINTLAEVLFLTPTYLCMIFKKETGKTINQHITEVRINRAKDYLREPGVRLYDIARRVGYSDGKYFTKVFDRIVGMKPKEYREIHCRDKKNL